MLGKNLVFGIDEEFHLIPDLFTIDGNGKMLPERVGKTWSTISIVMIIYRNDIHGE